MVSATRFGWRTSGVDGASEMVDGVDGVDGLGTATDHWGDGGGDLGSWWCWISWAGIGDEVEYRWDRLIGEFLERIDSKDWLEKVGGGQIEL